MAALLGALVLAAVALVLIINWRLDSRLDAIRAAGDPVTAVELDAYYPEPSPGQNAAPLFLEAFKLIKEPDDEERDVLPVVGYAELPEPGQPLPDEMREAVRSWLADHTEALALLRRATDMAQCKFPAAQWLGFDALTTHFVGMRAAVGLFALEAIEHIDRGQHAEAAESLRRAFRCGHALRKEPVPLSGLVRIACDSLALGYLERWADVAGPEPEVLVRLENALRAAAETDPEALERAMVGDRAQGILLNQGMLIRKAHFPMTSVFRADLCFYIDQMNRVVACARRPYPGSLIAGAKLSMSEENFPRYAFSAAMVLGGFDRVAILFQEHRARLDGARAAFAALRYRAKHGKLPASLDALVPDFIVAVPVDPFNAQRLLLRIEGDG
ncbi:hypothetical protein HQ576_15490, partial [bacterium]|nr:hypothetical protein [bacterium]